MAKQVDELRVAQLRRAKPRRKFFIRRRRRVAPPVPVAAPQKTLDAAENPV
ncbi:MAG: hypothetical protein M3516_09500 [Actinomycetota bacterium]|nr:hypothetical protein [Actinomycetota bacterium]